MAYGSIILLILDIDFFKRVNDNYGHSYGDVVLKAFFIRLEASCESILNDYEAELYCARPSGEEFSVLAAGNIGSDDELAIAERLREAIALAPLPGEYELGVMSDDARLRGVELPPITERQITPSIGLASRHSAASSEAAEVIAERMKVEADLSLYRAKALGRNRCVRFCDIVQRHGQVLQHHADVDVVAIDLGHQVGVYVGQEFLVFHPDFVGLRPFMVGDGRSERKLGSYPRVPHGRLEVFDVQPEISFSYVAEKRGIDRFPVGALLEAVPVGSIAHLVHKDWWRWRDLHALTPSEEEVERELLKVEPWDTASVASVRLGNEQALLESRGAGLLNRIYATLYIELRDSFKKEMVAQTGAETFSVILRDDPNNMEGRLSKTFEKVEEQYDLLPLISAGVFLNP